jgi:hypothetical protein
MKNNVNLNTHLKPSAMKKLTLTFVLVMAMMLLKAQITITSSDMPQPGKADIVGNDTISKHLNYGTASASAQSWDFTVLKDAYPKLAIYSPTSPYQAYASSFPGSNLYTWGPSIFFTSFYGGAPVYTDTYGYMYWKTDTAGFHIVGFRGDCGPNYGYMNVQEGPQELLMGTPAHYGSIFPDSARWMIEFNKVPSSIDHSDTIYKSALKKNLTVDAFGTMKIAFGVPSSNITVNVIRVHEHVIEVDSIIGIIDTVIYGYPFIDTIPYYQIHDTLNNYQFWANGFHYPIAIVHCNSKDSVIYTEYLTDTIPCYAITGNVFNNTGTQVVKAGTANLVVKDNWDHLFDWLETVPIDTNGQFQFADVAGGNFLVQANPDTTMYPYLEPTYYGDTTVWQAADTLTMNSNRHITIDCLNDSLLATLTGSISISGTILIDTTTSNPLLNNVNATAARGVKVILVDNPGGGCSRVRHTDNNGKYYFGDLPATNYKLIVDIPGLNMYQDSTYWINVGSKSTSYTDRDFIYDTSLIYIYADANIIEHSINNIYDVNIYPNPFNSAATVYISNPNSENRVIKFTLYDVAGRIIKEVDADNTEYFSITSDGLAKGMYIYEIRVNSEIVNSGKVVVN